MNLLPTLDSPVTRQEKMATVWDEAEVGARDLGVPKLGPGGRRPCREGRKWFGGHGVARTLGPSRLGYGQRC
jgi:hypothetical protein